MFSDIFGERSEFHRVKLDIQNGLLPMGMIGLSNVHKAHYFSSLSLSLGKKCLIICESEGSASKLCEDLNFFDGGAVLYPRREFCFDSSAVESKELQQRRIGVLRRVLEGNYRYVVTTPEAASQYTIPSGELKKRCVGIAAGAELPPGELIDRLLAAGYSRSPMVEGHGQFSSRGEILDVFPPDREDPVRIEFWGDEISRISSFDVESQRRISDLEELSIAPDGEVLIGGEELTDALGSFLASVRRKNAPEFKKNLEADIERAKNGPELNCLDKYISLAYPGRETLFDYFGGDILLFVAESRSARLNFEKWSKEFDGEVRSAKKDGLLIAGLDDFHISFRGIVEYYELFGAIFTDNFERGHYDTERVESLHRIVDAKTNAAWNGTISALTEDLEIAKRGGYAVCVVAGTEKMAKNIASDLSDSGTEAFFFDHIPEAFSRNIVSVMPGSLSSGFEYENEKFMLISYRRGGGSERKRKQRRAAGSKARLAGDPISLEEIKKGDYVVHSSYGIGVFEGITTHSVENVKADYLSIRYSDGQLFVPVEKIGLLTKYMSPENADTEVRLNSFNSTKAWERTKARVAESVREVAKELANVYSRRLNEVGHAFGEDDELQTLFESKFEFEETEDQLSAINDVKRDMQSLHPMDRLLLGDVGYGKTEVALRGVFKCVEEGKQCAILVPTTILALQHYQTLLKRFEGFAINIEMLSRFRTAGQKTKIRKDVRAGLIDVLIGTHGLISDSVEFRDLGLLIIDEEQRFGVKQKEKIKRKFPLVDVLTISATPIPRTLNMAVSGIRDMSILEMPPQDRHAVQTFVVEQDMAMLSRVMEKEINRGGQVYYLHNRVDTIDRRAEEIRRYLPDARIGIGHGKMSEEELSEVWRSLLDGEIDILVCTTIIETGIDVPNVNTLIVEEANRLGLAQLHQIRGRVGRSTRRAYAYFTYRPEKAISDTANARLTAIEQYTGFGAGYHIAMRDLEIRGAGEILGTQQHGHMAAVGYDMYIRMLSEAIEELGEVSREKPRIPCRIQVQMDMSIPDSYISSYANRIEIYKRILAIGSAEDARDVLDEVADRFGNEMRGGKNTGSIPKCVIDLVKYSELKARATAQGITDIRQTGRYITLYAEKISVRHAMEMKKLYGDKPVLSMDGLRQCMKIPLRGSQQALLVIERAVKCFESVELD